MDPNTHWWILGPPDCDIDGDGDAWTLDDTGEAIIDRDSVAGWKGGGDLNKDQEFVVTFDIGLEDHIDSNDLVICLYSGYKAKASIWASVDGNDFIEIGEVAGQDGRLPGIPGYLANILLDFGGRFEEAVRYVKVHREANGPDTGIFFDAIGSAVVMEPDSCNCEPGSCEQIHGYGWSLGSDLLPDCRIDEQDYDIFNSYFGLCNDPENPTCGGTDFTVLGYRPSCCHGMWQSGFGLPADLNHDCYVDCYDLYILANEWLEYEESGICHCCKTAEKDHSDSAMDSSF